MTHTTNIQTLNANQYKAIMFTVIQPKIQQTIDHNIGTKLLSIYYLFSHINNTIII